MPNIPIHDDQNSSFGMLLRAFRTRAGLNQEELARLIELPRPGTLGQWERGQAPSKSLDYIQAIIQVLELDASEQQMLHRALAVALESHQHPRTPPPRLRFVPPLPDHAIERALAAPLIAALTQRPPAGAQQYAAIILSGLVGIGKATLAKLALKDPTVQAAFPAGVLWLRWQDYPTETDFEGWCNALGVQRTHRQSWQDVWWEWLNQPHNAVLLVLEDVSGAALRRSWLGALLKALPPSAALLITTQDGDALMAEVQHWRPASSVQSFVLGGLSETEAYALATTILHRPPTAEEWAALRAIGAATGWHPEALRLAASAPAALPDTAAALTAERSLQRVAALIEAQWLRLPPSVQTQLLQLVGQAKVSGVFGRGYAAAVWQVTPEAAQGQLERLVGTGFIERVTEVQDPLWPWPADYRLMPAAQRFLQALVWTRQDTAPDLLRAAPTVLRAVRHLQRCHGAWLRPPWQFRLAAFFWQFFLVPKALVLGGLWLAQTLGAPRRWLTAWREGTMLLVAETMMRRHWAERGIEPPEEFWLLYDAHQGMLLWVWLAILALGITGPVCGLLSIRWSGLYPLLAHLFQQLQFVLLLATLGLVAWYFWQLPWRYWVVRHYGVRTWDLRLLLRLARFLGAQEETATD